MGLFVSQDRTEKATPRRRKKAREEGRRAQSKELAPALVFTGAFLVLSGAAVRAIAAGRGLFRELLASGLAQPPGPSMPDLWFGQIALALTKMAALPLLLLFVLALMGGAIQGPPVFSAAQLGPNWMRLSPSQNLARLISLGGLVELGKGLLLFAVAAYIGLAWGGENIGKILRLLFSSPQQIALGLVDLTSALALRFGLFLMLLAGLDYLFQRFRFERSLRMTKREVKEDLKESEGDPLVKGRIRRLQRDLLRRRMMAAVPRADVVVANPTEYAVALSYQIERMAAPEVVAKGQGHLARRIRKIAAEHGVPIVVNPPLAQALYRSVEVGQQIPAALYRAVAEVLAYVYKTRMMAQG